MTSGKCCSKATATGRRAHPCSVRHAFSKRTVLVISIPSTIRPDALRNGTAYLSTVAHHDHRWSIRAPQPEDVIVLQGIYVPNKPTLRKTPPGSASSIRLSSWTARMDLH